MPYGKGHFLGVWPIEKHCNLQSIEFWELGKRVSCAKNGCTHLNSLGPYTSYDVFLCKKLPLGVAMIAPVLKSLVALIF